YWLTCCSANNASFTLVFALPSDYQVDITWRTADYAKPFSSTIAEAAGVTWLGSVYNPTDGQGNYLDSIAVSARLHKGLYWSGVAYYIPGTLGPSGNGTLDSFGFLGNIRLSKYSDVPAVPEPSRIALIAVGLALILWLMRKQSRA
ncbi:MAG: PEP-CTERM sorting domain-containing protein, partial [Nitrospiraceae bacterium]